MKPTLLQILLLLILNVNTLFAQPVSIGAGSYNMSPPTGGSVPQHSSGQIAYPQVTAAFNQPIQTNDWWTSLLYKYYQNQTFLWEIHSWKLYAHPLAFTANRYGLDVKYPDQAVVDDYYDWTDAKYQYAMSNHDFTIGVEGLDMGVTDTVKTVNYGDWQVQAEWLDANGKMLQATMAHGSPYTYFETNTDEVYLRFLFGHTIDNTIGNNIVGFTTQEHHYAIFAPSGTTWNTNENYTFDENNLVGGTANPFAREAFKCDLNGKHYFSIAILPDNSLATLQEYANSAFAFIEDTEVTWSYDAATSELTNTFTVQTNPKEGIETNTLQALYYHQWKHSEDINTAYTYQSPRGLMKVVKGNTFTTTLKNNGILPVLPLALDASEQTTLYQFIEDEYQVSNTYVTTEDTYWQGKRFGRQADLIYIADQLGHIDARDKFLSDLKTELEDWLTAPDGETDRGYFYYDENWNTLIGYPASFGSDIRVTDHHFHYGYFIKAAATIARFDPNWIADNQWGSMVKLLIKDVNNWDKTDEMFPFLRCFDAYAGHSWANGHANSHWGNDQEASSESINFSAWVYALGLYTADIELRDLGLFLYLNEAETAKQYWLNQDGQAFPNDYGYQTATRIWGNGADKILGSTYEAESEYQLGINTFPIQAPLLYLGQDSAMIANTHLEAATIDDGIGDLWEDIMWGYLAMARPEEALTDYLMHTSGGFYNTNAPWLPDVTGIYNDFSDRSLAPAQIFHWLHALDSLGIVDTTTADFPAAMVFKKGNTKNYVVDNSGSEDLIVHFSDGEAVNALANTTSIKKINDSSCSLMNDSFMAVDEAIIGTYVANTISTQGTVTVNTSATFKASESITLKEGFSVLGGSDFLAIIEDCPTSGFQEEEHEFATLRSTIANKKEELNGIGLAVAPNPAQSQTTIQFNLKQSEKISLIIYDVNGRVVETLVQNKWQSAGELEYIFTPKSNSGGVFFVVLKTADTWITKKMIFLE